ncbi:hypothetical protein DL93DRAFT_2091354 [Clavulina sp. PMI_390]|nr:hypothetical protein DL93DRAFT_2091354 [Clavulina sp. PMI_390]
MSITALGAQGNPVVVPTISLPSYGDASKPGAVDINQYDPRNPRPPIHRHIDFFDTDKDGIVWPSDTARGLYKVGFKWVTAWVIAFVGHIGFAPLTVPHPKLTDIVDLWSLFWFLPSLVWSYIPDPFLRIYAGNLEFAKHTASTHTWNQEGWYEDDKFQKIWAFSGSPNKDTLTYPEAMTMIKSYRHGISDGWGLFKGPFEWTLLFWVVNPADGKVTKDQVKSVYAGTIFEDVVQIRIDEENKLGKRREFGLFSYM